MTAKREGPGYSLRWFFQTEGLDKAREFLQWSREHNLPREEADALAEIEFYEWLLALYDTGMSDSELRARPPAWVLRSVLDALDSEVQRDQEALPMWRRHGDQEKVRAAEARIAKASSLRPHVANFESAKRRSDNEDH